MRSVVALHSCADDGRVGTPDALLDRLDTDLVVIQNEFPARLQLGLRLEPPVERPAVATTGPYDDEIPHALEDVGASPFLREPVFSWRA